MGPVALTFLGLLGKTSSQSHPVISLTLQIALSTRKTLNESKRKPISTVTQKQVKQKVGA